MKFYTQVCSSDVNLWESFVTWSKQQSGHSSEEAHIVVRLDLRPFDFTVQGLVGRGWLIWKNNQLFHYSLSLQKKKVCTRIHSPKWAKHQFKLSRLSCMTNACETKDFSTIVKRVLISKPERDGTTCTKMYLSVYFDEGNQLL